MEFFKAVSFFCLTLLAVDSTFAATVTAPHPGNFCEAISPPVQLDEIIVAMSETQKANLYEIIADPVKAGLWQVYNCTPGVNDSFELSLRLLSPINIPMGTQVSPPIPLIIECNNTSCQIAR